MLSNYPLDPAIQLTSVAGDIQSTLNSVESQLSPLLDHPLPLVGNQLGSAVTSVNDLATKLETGLQNAASVSNMESALVSTLGPSGLGVLPVNTD
ncbi:MAG TPA: hypothetical protein VL970_02455, partial [Candidatus Acidoferrales bacterium]|nr:hypothetical protein [Candidatus Acidoferrales bacterium]